MELREVSMAQDAGRTDRNTTNLHFQFQYKAVDGGLVAELGAERGGARPKL